MIHQVAASAIPFFYQITLILVNIDSVVSLVPRMSAGSEFQAVASATENDLYISISFPVGGGDG